MHAAVSAGMRAGWPKPGSTSSPGPDRR
jgi:hypothetical protein